jgi:hypothetical protein
MMSLPKTAESTASELMPPQRTTPPLLMSLVLHVILLTTIGLFWSKMPSGTGAIDDRPVGIALVHRMPDRDRYVDSAEVLEPEAESETVEPNAASAASNPPAGLAPPLDLAGILQSMESTPTPESGSGVAGETDLGADAFGDDRPGGSPASASETTTTVFGISGSGSRFVYVFDRSDSMNGFAGNPLRQAKRELIRSLKTLTERQQFQIVFYNDKPTPFKLGGLPLQMVRAEDGYLNQAESYVRSIAAFGGTSHEDALKMAIRMGPDVIFFLTDARIPRLSSTQLREIMTRAESAGATIHAIEFGGVAAAPVNSFLRELAEMNGGQYRYIDVSRSQRENSRPGDPTTK